jgi:hypothetical protein
MSSSRISTAQRIRWIVTPAAPAARLDGRGTRRTVRRSWSLGSSKPPGLDEHSTTECPTWQKEPRRRSTPAQPSRAPQNCGRRTPTRSTLRFDSIPVKRDFTFALAAWKRYLALNTAFSVTVWLSVAQSDRGKSFFR